MMSSTPGVASPAAAARPRSRIPDVVVDGVLVVIVGVATPLAMVTALEPNSRQPDALAYGLGLLIAALLFGRRRWPVGVLLASTALLIVYYQLDYPGFFPGIPLAAAIYSAAATGHLRWALAVTALFAGGPLVYRTVIDPEPLLRVLNDVVRDATLLGAFIALGEAARSRRAYSHEVMTRLQRAEAERERVAQELKVAHLVQQQFLPDELPDLIGWRVAAFYRPAREVGGDFYDLTLLPEGKVGIAIGDVTDKGAPAALVMATTQALLRSEAQRVESPAEVLGHVNDVLVPNTPSKMFVTCLYLVLEPESGRVRFANAGHNLPYLDEGDAISELRATGMPLGLFPSSPYEESQAILPPGSRLLLYSDGVTEAHNGAREMFGNPRLEKVIENCARSENITDLILAELEHFVGDRWEQEDDITLVALERVAGNPQGA
jgi:serine phosphatase RsbU (regulator of sigma subunit)